MAAKVTPAEIEQRARDGFQIRVSEIARVTRRAPASIYRAIHRKELDAVWLGKTPMLTPASALRLLGLPQPTAPEPLAA